MSGIKRHNKQLVFLLILLSAATLIMTACTSLNQHEIETTPVANGSQQTQSNLELNWVKVSPSVVVPGQTVAVTGAVINNDNIEHVYAAELKINDVSQGMHEIDVSAGKTQTFSVFITEDEVGIYYVFFGGKTAQFEVVEQIDLTRGVETDSNSSTRSCCQ